MAIMAIELPALLKAASNCNLTSNYLLEDLSVCF